MNLLSGLLHGTPIWVFALFGYLLWAGIRGLTVSARKVSRVWITPAIFIAWGVIGLVMRSGPLAENLLHWFVAALVGAGVGVANTIGAGVGVALTTTGSGVAGGGVAGAGVARAMTGATRRRFTGGLHR